MNKNIVMSVAVLASLPALAFLQNVTPESQGISSSAIADFVDDGKLDLDKRVVDIFPEHVTERTSENMRQIRVRDLLTMNAGQDREAEYNDVSGDWVRAFISNDTPRVPGKGFRYDSCATHVAT